jgi:hypothetical protein
VQTIWVCLSGVICTWISVHDRYIFKIKNARSIKLWPLLIFFCFDIRDFPGSFIMAHQHKILWAINSGWGSPRRKWVSEFSDPFESLFLSHVIYYKVYLQVFICRKWVIFACINADSSEKDVQLHFVSGTKFYNKIFVTLYGFTGLEGYLFTFFFFTLL